MTINANSMVPINIEFSRPSMKCSKFIALLGLVVLLPVASVAQSDCPTRSDLVDEGVGETGLASGLH